MDAWEAHRAEVTQDIYAEASRLIGWEWEAATPGALTEAALIREAALQLLAAAADAWDDDEATVQMIDAHRYEDGGYVEYRGGPEPLEDWVNALYDYDVAIVSDAVKGWGVYSRIVSLTRDGATIYYLITSEVLRYLPSGR